MPRLIDAKPGTLPHSPPEGCDTHESSVVQGQEPEDLLQNGPWLALVQECVDLFDELDRLNTQFDPARREIAEHLATRLREVLERSGLAVISGDARFDRSRHQPEQPERHTEADALIAATLSPGFAAGRRVLRRARVRLGEE